MASTLTSYHIDTTTCAYVSATGDKCNRQTSGYPILCDNHAIIKNLYSDFYSWKNAKIFFQNHVYCNYTPNHTRHYQIEYFNFIPKTRWEELEQTGFYSEPSDAYNDKSIIHIFQDDDLFEYINIDGTINIDYDKYSDDYEEWLIKYCFEQMEYHILH